MILIQLRWLRVHRYRRFALGTSLCLSLALLFAPGAHGAVVEFYDADLDNYFITADPSEQRMVDSGVVGNWRRTGNSFAAGGASPVCRFYGNSNVNPATGLIYGPNSHFYTADANECAGLKAAYTPTAKSWKFESNDFLTTPASNGACASGLVPVYRAYNNGFARGVDSNHRITSNYAAYQQAVGRGWSGEGIVMCAHQPADLNGIYVFSNDVGKFSGAVGQNLATASQVPGIDGLTLEIGWDTIEPARGQFQWATLDSWLALSISQGKKVGLVVTAGASTPAWLFQSPPTGAGARALQFTVSPHNGATGICDSEAIAPPWDSAFLSEWSSMLSALAAHLKAAGTYGAIVHLRLTGINRTTDELRLPAETPQSSGLACVSNAISIWQQAGYRPSLLLQAWDAITAAFQANFPDKAFSVTIITQNAFPRIAEDGSVIVGTVPDQNAALLSLASQRFPGRLIIAYNYLMPGEAASSITIQEAQTLNTLLGFQTNEYLGSTGQGAACAGPVTQPTACTNQTFLAMLLTGIYPLGQSNPLRSQYIEVFQANARAFPDAVQKAHDASIAGP